MNKNFANALHRTIMQTVQENRDSLIVNSTSHRIKDDDVLALSADRLVNKTSDALKEFLRCDGTLTDAFFYIGELFSDKQLADLVHRRLPTYYVMPDPLEDNGQQKVQ